MKLFLVGFMGSGKSTFGRKLASRLHLPFYDLDTYIEEKEGKSIPAIFEEEGEDGFRLLESRYLKECAGLADSLVLATGGGTPCFYGNMEWMLEQGKVLYLKMSAVSIHHRLMASKKQRPLFQNMKPETQLAEIGTLLEKRAKVYALATFTVNGTSPNVVQVIHMLESANP